MGWEDLTRRQRGVIAREQLTDCGVSLPRIDGLVARRGLVEVVPSVYAPRPVPLSRRQMLWAVALWSSGGVISHRSAARLWRLPIESTQIILLDRALQRGWLDERSLTKAIRDGRGRTGNSQLRLLLAAIETGAHAESERKLHAILRRARLTGWVAQYRITLPNGVAFADVAFPEHLIAIEVDGRRHHDAQSDRFEEDRLRQNEIVLRGWRVLRFTWKMLTERPDLVLSRIVQLLAA